MADNISGRNDPGKQKEVALIVTDEIGLMICAFFGGIVETTPDNEMKRIAGKNYLRLYKCLSIDAKKTVRNALYQVYGNGQVSQKQLIEKLHRFLDDLDENL